jgi:hypothetical protein
MRFIRGILMSLALLGLMLPPLAIPATVITEGSSSTQFVGTGTNNNDVVIQTNDVQRYNAFILLTTAGAVDVLVSLDGTNYSTEPLSLIDFGATTQDPVIVTAAGRVYGFRGKFKYIRILQNGATAVASATLLAGIV